MQISIIIPTFNRAKLLPLAIESVKKQTSAEWELIIIDDGSQDETRHNISGYLNDNRIKYIYQEHKGVSAARNLGVSYTTGLYIVFLDSDDKLHPELIEHLYAIGLHNYDLIFWEVLKITDGKKSIRKPQKLGGLYNNIKGTFLAGSICYNKNIFEKAGGYDSKMNFGENYELGLRVSQLQNLRTRIIHRPLLTYEINTKSRSSNSLDNRLLSGMYQYRKHLSKYKNHPKENAKMNYLLGYIMEKKNQKKKALNHYKSSWMNNPLNYKALMKIIFLSFIK